MFKKVRVPYIVYLVVLVLMLTGCSESSLEVTGVEDNKSYSTPVTPMITAGSGMTVAVTLNGVEFASGTEINEPGDYELVVVSEKEGETVTETYSFTISLYPQIQVIGVEDGGEFINLVTPVITTADADDTVVITLNGAPYTSGTDITEPGVYTLEVKATNAGEYVSTESHTFSLYKAISLAIDRVLTGFGTDKATSLELNTDPQFLKNEERSLKFVNQTGTKSAFRIQRNPHPSWPADWTQLERMTFWVYIENVEALQDNAMEWILSTLYGNKSKRWANTDFVNGWNFCEVDLPEVIGGDLSKLVDMDEVSNEKGSRFLDIIVRSPINVVTAYFTDFTLWYPLP